MVIVIEVRLYREAVARTLGEHADLRLRGEADCAHQALVEIGRTRPDVVLLDLGIPHALSVVRLARVAVPDTRVVALGFGGNDNVAIAAAEAGLSGYIGIRQPPDSDRRPIPDRLLGANTRCAAKYGAAFRSAEERYRRAAAHVFVYGSDRAYAAERRLAKLIVPDIRRLSAAPLSSKRTAARLVKDGSWTREKAQAFERGYVDLQRVMCRELSAQPRDGCTKP